MLLISFPTSCLSLYYFRSSYFIVRPPSTLAHNLFHVRCRKNTICGFGNCKNISSHAAAVGLAGWLVVVLLPLFMTLIAGATAQPGGR